MMKAVSGEVIGIKRVDEEGGEGGNVVKLYSPGTISTEDEEKALTSWQELMVELDFDKSLARQEFDSGKALDAFSELVQEDHEETMRENERFQFDTMDCLEVLFALRQGDGTSSRKLDPSTVCQGFKRLQELTAVKRGNRAQLGLNGGCETVLSQVQMYMHEADVCSSQKEILEEGCMVIANLSYDTRNKTRFGELGACECLSEILKSMASNASVMKRVCWAVINLSVSHPTNVQRFTTCKALALVTEMLLRHSEDAGIVQWGCLAIAYLAADPGSAAGSIGRHSCQTLAQVLRGHGKNSGVVEEVLRAISALVHENACNREEVGSIGAPQTGCLADVVASLQMHTKNAEIGYWGCMCLSNLCRDSSENKSRLHSLDVFSCVLSIMNTHTSNVAVVDQCLWSLLMFAKDPEYAGLLGSLVSVPVVKMLTAYPDQPDVIERGSKILVYLTSLTTDGFVENINLVVRTDSGLETIVATLKTYHNSIQHATILYWTVVLLNNLCNDKPRMILSYMDEDGKNVNVYDANKSVLRSTGAFSYILDAMECNIEDAVLVEEMCKFVNNLIGRFDFGVWGDLWTRAYSLLLRCSERHSGVLAINYLVARALFPIVIEVMDRVEVLEGILTMLRVLQNHSNSGMVFWALRVINRLGSRSDSIWSILGSKGACETIMNTLRDNYDDEKIVEQGCWLWHSLAVDASNSVKFGDADTGGCELLVALLKQHISSVAVVERLCCAVNNLSFNNPNNASRLGTAGILPLILACAQVHLEEADVAYWCSSAINNLICNNPSNLRAVGEIGGCEEVVEILKRFITHCAVTEQACIVIQNLSFLETNRRKLRDYHAVEVLKSASKMHGGANDPARLNENAVSNVGPEITRTLEKLTGVKEQERSWSIPIISSWLK